MKNFKKVLSIVLSIILAFSFAACSKSNDGDIIKSPQEINTYTDNQEMTKESKATFATSTSTTSTLNVQYQGNRKIVRNADLSLSTEKYSATIKAIEKAVSNVSGYIEGSSEDKYGEYTNLYLTIRVPAEKLDEFLEAIDGTATVTSKSISTEDITSSYADTESHIAALKTEQETLLSLLSKASNLSEILQIQDRLTEVRSNIEYYQSMMNTYNDELSYSTVNMSITEVSHEIETGDGFWSSIIKGLKESFYDVGVKILNFFSWTIVHIPYLLIFAVIIFLLCAIIKKIKNKIKCKKNKKESLNAGQTDSTDVSGQK